MRDDGAPPRDHVSGMGTLCRQCRTADDPQLPEPAVAQARQQVLDRDHLLRSALSAVANSPEPAHGLRISSGTSMSSSG